MIKIWVLLRYLSESFSVCIPWSMSRAKAGDSESWSTTVRLQCSCVHLRLCLCGVLHLEHLSHHLALLAPVLHVSAPLQVFHTSLWNGLCYFLVWHSVGYPILSAQLIIILFTWFLSASLNSLRVGIMSYLSLDSQCWARAFHTACVQQTAVVLDR